VTYRIISLYLCTDFIKFIPTSWVDGAGAEDATQKLVRLLQRDNPDFTPNSDVVERIRQSNFYASRLFAMATARDAVLLYMDAERAPQTTTCAEIYRTQNIAIGDPLSFKSSQATFLQAFENGVPKILKIPMESSKVNTECQFYELIYKDSQYFSADVPLVPVAKLQLHSSVKILSNVSPEKDCGDSGVLMPKYSHCLADIPIPITTDFALAVGQRILAAATCMHSCGYLHADIKPGNIFFDFNGLAWLGDYGSSVNYIDVLDFLGGTARYQCVDVLATSYYHFDYMGLALTLLESCGLVVLKNGTMNNLGAVRNAISEVTDGQLQNFLSDLMPAVETKK
jgi:serine/threonine protein kinase